MEKAYSMYNVIVIFWYLVSFFTILMIYYKCIKRYASKNERKVYEKNPKKISNGELSYLMYKNIIPEVFTSTILDLINRNYLVVTEENGEYYLSEGSANTSRLSQSEKYLLDMINRMIDGKKSISITKLGNYSNHKKDGVDFLINYQVYLKILRNESNNVPYYETKLIYSTMDIYKNVTYFIWLLSFVFTYYKYYSILVYLLIIVSFLINELSIKSYKRTKDANDLYFDYIAYKNYLNEIDKLEYDKKEINHYIMTGLILKVKGVSEKLNQGDFPTKLDVAVNKCVKKALLRK